MVVYLVTSIFETEPGQFKKYTMAYDSLDAALEYVELDMASQYEGIYKEVLTDDIKEMVRMREDFFFKYGQMPHYIMIERLDVLSALPENVDNVVRFSLTEHMIEPVKEVAEEEEEEMAEEMAEGAEEEEEEEEEEESPEEDFEFSAPVVPEENMNEISSAETENESPESMMNEESVESPTENMDSDINGLEEEEELMPSPETFVADNSESNMENSNMESNIPSEAEVGENMNASASTESNIPAALRTVTGGKRARRTRRKAEKGKNKSRKA